MEIKEVQRESEKIVNEVYDKIGAAKDSEAIFLHLVEELGEISRQINNPKLKRQETDIDSLREEIADVILLVSKLASNYNIDIEKAVKNKIEKLKQRHNLKE